MDELQVVINEKPGELTWNFEQLKEEIAAQVEVYETIVYTDENIGEAKKDLAALRKLSKAVEDRRKDIKKRWMAPYQKLEEQAKELVEIIDGPISTINAKVTKYEAEERAKKEGRIRDYFEKALADVPEEVRDVVIKTKWDDRWTLKSVSKGIWASAIDEIAEQVVAAVRLINGLEEEYRDPCKEVYVKTLDVTSVMSKQQEMAKQKAHLEEVARKREEAEAAMRESAKSESAAETAQEPQGEVESISTETSPSNSEKRFTDEFEPQDAADEIYQLDIKATPEQINKILGYIKFVGAEVLE